jgi:cyclic beta-1,2-glucan synthetase
MTGEDLKTHTGTNACATDSRPEPAWEALGAALARGIRSTLPRSRRRARPADMRPSIARLIEKAAGLSRLENAEWVLDNVRLIHGTEKDAREFAAGLYLYPAVADDTGGEIPRVLLLSREYLDHSEDEFSEDTLGAFLDGFQSSAALDMGEIWGLKPALQLELIRRLLAAAPARWPAVLTSLRRIGEANWKEVFEAASRVEGVLGRDPAGAYTRMDFDSRDRYRNTVGEIAQYSPRSEVEVAEAAIRLAAEANNGSDGSRAAQRRAHVGFYLIDRGRAALEAAAGYRPPPGARLSRFVVRRGAAFYLSGIELLTFALVVGMLMGLSTLTPIFAGLVLLLLPASQAAVDFMNNLVTSLIPPRALPKLDFSDGIPDDCATIVAVPTLLISEAQVHDLVLDLEIRFLANRDPNLYFGLLTDSPDSDRQVDQRDTLVDVCRRLIERLNQRYGAGGRPPFFMLHRHRAYNESEGRWMGWERKRGKLLDLNRVLRGGFDAFPVKVGDIDALRRARYVITLDSDTQLPRDAAARLVGAIAHPLNQAVVDPATKMVVEGYGILQPRIGISIQSASRSRLAALYSGQTGFDIYTRAVSDVYQDLFGEGIFTGKGIYEVDVLREVLEQRFPENALLSHDLIEGAYARAGLVSDIELIDDYPSHFSSYCRRKHRWVRGDWQIMRWVKAQVPDYNRRNIPNPISLISRWKILDNLRRSLLEPALLMLFLGSWFYLPGVPGYWTAATVAVLFIPVYASLLFAAFRAPRERRALVPWLRETADAFAQGNAIALFSLIFLLHQALLSLDAIFRSLGRLFVTRRRLLEWETAAQAEAASRRKATVDVYLEWAPWITCGLAAAVWLVRPAALPAAAPILALWVAARPLSGWLNRPPRAGHCELNHEAAELLRDSAARAHRYFHDWSTPATNWLIPDSVREDGAAELRLSPTNLAMLLNARIAAVHLGLSPLAEFVFETRKTLECVLGLAKYRGHLYNWYDISRLAPLEPQFVSTVDSGNLAAALWTLKQAALAFAVEPPARRGLTKAVAAELAAIAELCDRLVREMNFTFLYNKRKKALAVGYNASTDRREPSCYDLLASEARLAVFVAVAKGEIPQEAWFRLGRAHTLFRGERVLLSWTGTMFEYLMPALWTHSYPGTILDHSMKSVVRAQREYARRKGVPWGISESACLGEGEGAYGYRPFGIRELAMKRLAPALVISPYSSFLAAAADPAEAVGNLRNMQEYGWTGRYGFYEAIDYSGGDGGEPVRMWMAHHQGMTLLAIANLLFDNPLRRYFHSEPHVMATELLLHERIPATALAEPETVPELGLVPAVG